LAGDNSPMNSLRNLSIFIIVNVLLTAPSSAAPQAQAGDVGLRHDIQVLADYGAISGPVTMWPLSWDALLADLEKVEADDIVLPNAVMPTFHRILQRARRETTRGQHSYGGHVAGAQEPAQIRGFANTPREQGEIGAEYSWFGEHLSIDLNLSVVDDPADGEDFRPDGSQIGVDLGNWSIAASTMDRWWGPGWDGSLILSNNARPIPALTIGRNLTKPFNTKFLSWLGPWDINMIWGQLEAERTIPNTQFFGMRFNFRPLKSLEIGVSRTALWCGDGRPCGFDAFWDLFLGRDNIGTGDTTLENEPSDQMAGFDVRWTTLWFGTPVSLYGQLIGEDEAGGFPSRNLAQFGIEGSGITRGQYSYRWFAEAAVTDCEALSSAYGFNCAYRHDTYQSGYTYRRRIIGHGLDNDARVVSAGIIVVSSEGNFWQVLGRFGELNRVLRDGRHTVAIEPQDLASVDIQHTRYTRIGRFDIGLGFERREILATGENSRDTRGFIRWSSH
ncbi:MAG: hypothetical protein ACI9BW_004452, partial [Gammaproteobacteria bacterium]